MLKKQLTAGVLALAALASIQDATAQQNMTIILSGKYILTGSAAVMEVMGLNCNQRIVGQWTIASNQEIPVIVYSDGAGYGKRRYAKRLE